VVVPHAERAHDDEPHEAESVDVVGEGDPVEVPYDDPLEVAGGQAPQEH